jgi:hypothetical protein
MAIYDAAMRYLAEGVPTVVFAGEEYGTGSSRDWAAKGTQLLGIKAVIAKSFERIHRANLVGMGVLPLQFKAGDTAASLGLRARDVLGERSATGLTPASPSGRGPARRGGGGDGGETRFEAIARLDGPIEVDYRQGGSCPRSCGGWPASRSQRLPAPTSRWHRTSPFGLPPSVCRTPHGPTDQWALVGRRRASDRVSWAPSRTSRVKHDHRWGARAGLLVQTVHPALRGPTVPSRHEEAPGRTEGFIAEEECPLLVLDARARRRVTRSCVAVNRIPARPRPRRALSPVSWVEPRVRFQQRGP